MMVCWVKKRENDLEVRGDVGSLTRSTEHLHMFTVCLFLACSLDLKLMETGPLASLTFPRWTRSSTVPGALAVFGMERQRRCQQRQLSMMPCCCVLTLPRASVMALALP